MKRVPPCAVCGRTLPKYDVKNDRQHLELAMGSLRKSIGFVPRVESDEVAEMLGRIDAGEFTADGQAPSRGAYGDNLLCSQVCGHILAIRLLKALGMDVLALLPEQWRRR